MSVCACLTSSDIDTEGVLCRCESVSDLQTLVLKAHCIGVCMYLTSSDLDAEGVLCRCVSVLCRRTVSVCECV